MNRIKTRIKVVLADDKELFREGLVKLLESESHIEVVSGCDNGSEAVEKAKENKPDIVLMDVHIENCNGIEATQRITESLPNTKVVMLTDSREEEKLFSALQAGAKGYLVKDIEIETLVKSIDLITKGEVVISPPLGGKLLDEFGSMREEKEARGAESETDLSERETEILRLVAKGATNKEIAERLIIAENTVKVHIKSILDKLQLRNKQQAAAYAVQQGLVTEVKDRDERPS